MCVFSVLQGLCVTGPLTSTPAGPMGPLEPLSMSLAHGFCHGTIKVSVLLVYSVCSFVDRCYCICEYFNMSD